MLHCTWKRGLHHSLEKSIWGALRAERRPPLLGQATSMSCGPSEPWNQFLESKRPVTRRGWERPQQMPLQCLIAVPRGVSVHGRHHLGQCTHVFQKQAKALSFTRTSYLIIAGCAGQSPVFHSVFALMQHMSIVNWSHLIQGLHIPRDFVTITQCVRPWLKLFFLRGLWIHIYFAAHQLSHNSTMKLSSQAVGLVGTCFCTAVLLLYTIANCNFFPEIYKLCLRLRAIHTHHTEPKLY